MLPRFRVAHERSTTGPFKSRVSISIDSYMLCPTRSGIDYKFRIFQRTIASMPYFGAFSFHFYSVSTISVALQRHKVATTVTTVAIIVARVDHME